MPSCGALSPPLSQRAHAVVDRAQAQAETGVCGGDRAVCQWRECNPGLRQKESSNIMKFVILTYGTEGDTRPLAALCAALAAAGHKPHLLADHSKPGAARALGVPVSALSGDIKAALQPALAGAGAVAGRSRFKSTANALAGIANSNAQAWLRDTVKVAEGPTPLSSRASRRSWVCRLPTSSSGRTVCGARAWRLGRWTERSCGLQRSHAGSILPNERKYAPGFER